jgi:hypothetical protein
MSAVAAVQGRLARPRALARYLPAVGVALAMWGCFLTITVKIPLAEFFPETGVSWDVMKMIPDWRDAAVWYLLPVFLSQLGFLAALFLAWKGLLPTWLAFVAPVAFGATLVFIYPPTAVDLFHNLADGRTFWVFGDNPMTTAPQTHPFPIGYSYSGQPSPYGPLWTLLTFPVEFTEHNFMHGLYALKAQGLLFLLGSAGLAWAIVRRSFPGKELVAVVLVAWNPYFQIEIVGNGHNDAAVVFFLLLGVYLLHVGWPQAGYPAFTAAVLIKFAPVFLGPLLLAYAWRNLRDRPVAVFCGLGLSVALLAAAIIPFWEGFDTFDTLRGNVDLSLSSPAWILQDRLSNAGHPQLGEDLARWGGRGLFVVAYLWLLVAYLRTPRSEAKAPDVETAALARTAFHVFFALLFFATTWFRPWYLAWPLAMLALTPMGWPLAMSLLISLPVMYFEPFWYTQANEYLRENYFVFWGVRTSFAFFLPVLGYAALAVLWLRRQRKAATRRDLTATPPAQQPVFGPQTSTRQE